ncbi:MAG: hypothetical protein R2813_07530 [Flavobacteriales bacterium]
MVPKETPYTPNIGLKLTRPGAGDSDAVSLANLDNVISINSGLPPLFLSSSMYSMTYALKYERSYSSKLAT